MELGLVTIIFRSVAILFGVILLVLSILIYERTRDATKGWFYLSAFGVSLFLWSTTATLFRYIDVFLIRGLSGIIFLFLIGFFIVSAYSRLSEDLWIEKPKWITQKNMTIISGIIYLALLVFNTIFFWQDFQIPLVKYLSITHLWLGFAFLIAAIPTYYLMKKGKNAQWTIAFFAVLVVGLSLNAGQYYDNCCSENGIAQELTICEGYDLDYIRVYETSCVPWLVTMGRFYQFGLVIGIVLIAIQFYVILKNLKKEK